MGLLPGEIRASLETFARMATALERIADAMEEPAMEDPPDTSWVETQDIKRDYGR